MGGFAVPAGTIPGQLGRPVLVRPSSCQQNPWCIGALWLRHGPRSCAAGQADARCLIKGREMMRTFGLVLRSIYGIVVSTAKANAQRTKPSTRKGNAGGTSTEQEYLCPDDNN